MTAKKSALAFANTLVGAFLGLIALKLLALYLGMETIGRVEYAMGFIGILFFITDLGIPTAHVKRVSEGMNEGDCWTTFTVFKVVSTAAFVMVTAGILFVRVGVLEKPIESTTVPVILLMMGYFATNSLRQVYISTFDARRETARREVTLLADTATRVIASILLALVYAALKHNAGPLAGRLDASTATGVFAYILTAPAESLAWTYLLAGLIALFVTIGVGHRHIQTGRFRWDIMRGYAYFALPIFLATTVGAVSGYIDRAALGYFGSAVDTGAFGPLRRISQVMEAIPMAIAMLLFPTFSGFDAAGDQEGINVTLGKAVRYTSMVMLPLTILMMVYARPIIHIAVSNEWLPFWETLSMLAAFVFVIAISRPYVALAIGLNRPGIAARNGILLALSNIALNLILIPEDIKSLGIQLFGLKSFGAALATFLSAVLGYAHIRWETRHLVGPHGAGAFWRQLVAAVLMTLVLLAANALTVDGIGRWYHLVAYGTLGGVAYLAGLAVVGGLTRADVAYLWDAANPFEMLAYVKEEVFGRRR